MSPQIGDRVRYSLTGAEGTVEDVRVEYGVTTLTVRYDRPRQIEDTRYCSSGIEAPADRFQEVRP